MYEHATKEKIKVAKRIRTVVSRAKEIGLIKTTSRKQVNALQLFFGDMLQDYQIQLLKLEQNKMEQHQPIKSPG